VADQLRGFGLTLDDGQVITSAVVAARMLRRHLQEGARVLVIGSDHLRDQIRLNKMVPVGKAADKPEAVIQAWYPELSWQDLAQASFAIEGGARYFTTNKDQTLPREGGMSEDVVERTITDPDYLIRLATALKDERAARAVAEQKVGELQPKARALDLLADASGSYSVAEAAKMLSGAGCAMRVRDLADWLSSHGWVYRRDGHWVASQMRVNAGHLMMRAYESTGRLKDGSSFAFAPQVRVTAKGLSLIARHVSQDRLDAVQSKDLRRAA